MNNYYNSLRSLVSHEMISKAATVLDESEERISGTSSSIIASLLGVMLKNGGTPQIMNILEDAGRRNLLLEFRELWAEQPTLEQLKIGDDFLQHLLGDKAVDFTDPIAKNNGISNVAANKLIAMIAPLFCGFLGNKLVKENKTMSMLLNEIRSEKNDLIGMIPSDLIKSFGLSSVLNTDTKKEDKKNNWVIWVVLVVLLLLLLWGWRSCRSNETERPVEQVATTDTIAQTPTSQQSSSSANRASNVLRLPDSTKINVYEKGVEDAMVKFLQSDEYKKAKDSELKEKWFEFDNIAFGFGSSTELKPESETQLDNIASILKNYKDARIKIAAFADKKGTEAANLKVSQERAKTIESLLEKRGVGSQIVKVQGYGDEFAKHSASESEAKRAEDRDIALRFVKK
ncbi:MAG: OmpA family protein [Prevotella sp.]|jgi:outer membrane protein OmpA-like peptidoglycan-associated protein|nr:OmpA family protein [Prevotella sp.]